MSANCSRRDPFWPGESLGEPGLDTDEGGRLREQGQDAAYPEKSDSLARLLENERPYGAEGRRLGQVYPG